MAPFSAGDMRELRLFRQKEEQRNLKRAEVREPMQKETIQKIQSKLAEYLIRPQSERKLQDALEPLALYYYNSDAKDEALDRVCSISAACYANIRRTYGKSVEVGPEHFVACLILTFPSRKNDIIKNMERLLAESGLYIYGRGVDIALKNITER